MKKLSVFAILITILALVVSCASSGTQLIPDASKETTFEDYNGHQYTSDLIYQFICDYASSIKGDDKSITMTKDDKALSVKLDGMKLSTLVGPLAQNGEAEISMLMKVEGNKATCTISFVNSYGYVSVGPISKQMNMDLHAMGLELYEAQCDALLYAFENAMSTYAWAYAVENDWTGYMAAAEEGLAALEEILDVLPVELTITNWGKKIDDGSVIGEIVKVRDSECKEIAATKKVVKVYGISSETNSIGTTELHNDQVIIFELDNKNDDPGSVCVVAPHISDRKAQLLRDRGVSDTLSYIAVGSQGVSSEYYNVYTACVTKYSGYTKPGYYDVIISDGYSSDGVIYFVIELTDRPDGFQYE